MWFFLFWTILLNCEISHKFLHNNDFHVMAEHRTTKKTWQYVWFWHLFKHAMMRYKIMLVFLNSFSAAIIYLNIDWLCAAIVYLIIDWLCVVITDKILLTYIDSLWPWVPLFLKAVTVPGTSTCQLVGPIEMDNRFVV
jgi:hypothetical protein